ncbi:hypothetical protein [Helicobacter pylori]|uniref:hypothetical protein n=1 Tax=Helicobacter pylori TaxID=210 RepID=UPI002FCD7DA7
MQGLENNNFDLKNLPGTPLYPLKNPILTPEQLEQKKKDLIVDLNQKSKELTELGLLDKLGGFVGYQTENAKEREKQLTDLKTQALDNKIEFKDLPGALKDEYYNKAETSILNPLKTKNEIAKEDYKKDLQRKAILQKKSQELTESDKELIDNDSGFFNHQKQKSQSSLAVGMNATNSWYHIPIHSYLAQEVRKVTPLEI